MQTDSAFMSQRANVRHVVVEPIAQPVPRKLQTLMTDKDFAQIGMAVFPPSQQQIIQTILGYDAQWLSDSHILLPVQTFSSLVAHTSADDPYFLAERDKKFRNRLSELRDIASDESIDFVESSNDQALSFLTALPWAALPSVYLVGNGNLRLVWNKNGDSIGLHFLGDERVQFVLIQSTNGDTSHVMGVKSISKIRQFIDQLGLRTLMR